MLDLPTFDHKTRVTYSDPYDVYSALEPQLMSRLPLTNLHWNPADRPLRSITKLDVDLVREETVIGVGRPQHQMLGLSSAPYLKLLFVKSEDVDMYRSAVRPSIRDWLKNNVQNIRDPTEWLVVLYVPEGGGAAQKHRFRSSVFDKMKTDFNSGSSKRDRCVQIKPRSSYDSDLSFSEAWADFMGRIKDGVLEAFSRRVDLYQDETAKLESQRHIAGWNFGNFFVMKEGLAYSFEYINLLEDALLVYDELQRAFDAFSTETSVVFFSSVGFDDERSPTTLLSHSTEFETVRHQIISNSISLFDFHCYLFARQAYLTLVTARADTSASISAARIASLFYKLRTFLNDMTMFLFGNKKPVVLVYEWVYNVACEFLAATQSVLVDSSPSQQQVSDGRGELLLTARKSLEMLAAVKNWHIEGVLGEVSLDQVTDQVNLIENVQNQSLVDALQSPEKFYAEYRRLTLEASAEFERAERTRSVNRLSCQLALLDYQLGHYNEAITRLESVPNLYSRQGWDVISSALQLVYIQCLHRANRPQAILLNSLDLLSKHKYLTKLDISQLLANVNALAADYGNDDVLVALDWLFSASVVPHFEVGNADGQYQVRVQINVNLNMGDKQLQFDQGSLVLVSADDTESITLRCASPVITGKTSQTLIFSTTKFVKTRFRVQALRFVKGKLAFSQDLMSVAGRPGPEEGTEIILDMFPLPSAFRAHLAIPHIIALDDRRIQLNIEAAGSPVTDCVVKITPATPGLRLVTQKCVLADSQQAVAVVGSRLKLDSVKSASILVPFALTGNERRNVQVSVSIEYKVDGVAYSYAFSDYTEVALPVDVKVHDFFRPAAVFSRFSVACRDSATLIRLVGVSVSESEMYKVSSPPGTDGVYTVFPKSKVTYVYLIEKKDLDSIGSDPLAIRLKFRVIRDEIMAIVWDQVRQRLDDKDKDYEFPIKDVLAATAFDVGAYALEGIVRAPVGAIDRAIKESGALESDSRPRIGQILQQAVDESNSANWPQASLESITRELHIPVSVPEVDVVHRTKVAVGNNRHFVVGHPIEAGIEIQSAVVWAAEKSRMRTTVDTPLYYELSHSAASWLVSGKTRGVFHVDPTSNVSTFTDIVTLIPLRTGSLVLPHIAISPGTATDLKMEIENATGAQTALVVPESDQLVIAL